jgi:phosphatidylserine decarboxylase
VTEVRRVGGARGWVRGVGAVVENERVAVIGEWGKAGATQFCAVVAVGCCGQGSVVVDERVEEMAGRDGFEVKMGDDIAGFKSGSAVVVVFEAPPGFVFDVKPGDDVLAGQALGHFGKRDTAAQDAVEDAAKAAAKTTQSMSPVTPVQRRALATRARRHW